MRKNPHGTESNNRALRCVLQKKQCFVGVSIRRSERNCKIVRHRYDLTRVNSALWQERIAGSSKRYGPSPISSEADSASFSNKPETIRLDAVQHRIN
jgi:hypothetical protein